MEELLNDLHHRGETLETTTKHRLQTKTLGSSGSNPRGFENLGTTFGAGSSKKNVMDAQKTTSSQARSQPPLKPKFKPSVTKNTIPSSSNSNFGSQSGKSTIKSTRDTVTKKKPDVILDSSDDEIDFLSPGDYDILDPSSSQVPVTSKLQRNTFHKETPATEIPMVQKLQSTSAVYKSLKFNKKKVAPKNHEDGGSEYDASSLVTPKPRTSSHGENIREGRKPPRRSDTPPWMKPTSPEQRHLQEPSSSLVKGLDEDADDTLIAVPPAGKNAKSKRRVSPSPPRSRRVEPTRKPACNNNPILGLMPRPKPRPRGRANATNATNAVGSSQGKVSLYGPMSVQNAKKAESSVRVNSRKKSLNGLRGRSQSRSRYSSGSDSRSSSADSSKGRTVKKKKTPDDFPDISPTSSPLPPTRRTVAEFSGMSLSPLVRNSKTSGKALKPEPSSSRIPAAFPIFSPPAKKSDSSLRGHLTKLAREKDKGKGRATSPTFDDAKSEPESESEKRKKRKASKRQKKLEEFPMNTQMLQSIDSTSPVRPRKRLSEDGSDDEHMSKKSRKILLQSPSLHPFEDEGDSISIAPHVDPKTLCPYCDSPLPSTPSPLLLKMLAATKKKSQRDPRPSNPLGLRAPLTAFIAACQRHRFESQILPEAERKGWPKKIEWNRVGARIMKMKGHLQALIEDPPEDSSDREGDRNDWDVVYAGSKAKQDARKRGKEGSIFWMEIMEEVKQKGLRAVSGVRGQFANFEKAQPGYYGEIGSAIIHQTLYNMFPLDEMDPAPISPLTANEFVQRILVPEVALRLIMEDKRLCRDDGIQEALKILRESSAYGVAMFPEDGGEEGEKKRNEQDNFGAGDLIVMERARKRRKEIEEEAEREEAAERNEEMRKADEEKQRKRDGKEKEKRSNGIRKVKDAEPIPASSQTLLSTEPPSSQPPRPRPRPRPARGASSMSIASSTTFDEEQAQIPPTKSRSRSAHSVIATDASDGTDSDIYASDREPQQRASSDERRRSPSASETRDFRHQSRAASRGVAGLHLGSDSDASMKGVVGRTTRSKSRSISRFSEKHQSRTLDKETEESEGEVEIVQDVLSPETPVQRRPTTRYPASMDVDEDDQETPKRAKPAKEAAVPPLERARLRKLGQESGSQVPAVRQRTIPVKIPSSVLTSDFDNGGKTKHSKSESFSWLLESQSSPSY